jgi:putative transposase
VVYLKAYGFVRVFRIVSKNEDTNTGSQIYWIRMNQRDDLANKSWKIEEYRRGIKQLCGMEKCQARKKESQREHVMLSLRAFLG